MTNNTFFFHEQRYQPELSTQYLMTNNTFFFHKQRYQPEHQDHLYLSTKFDAQHLNTHISFSNHWARCRIHLVPCKKQVWNKSTLREKWQPPRSVNVLYKERETTATCCKNYTSSLYHNSLFCNLHDVLGTSCLLIQGSTFAVEPGICGASVSPPSIPKLSILIHKQKRVTNVCPCISSLHKPL